MRKNGHNDFTLLVASAESKLTTHKHTHKDTEIKLDVQYGDFSKELANAAAALKEAKAYAANDNQSKMLDGYIKRCMICLLFDYCVMANIGVLICRFQVSKLATWNTIRKVRAGGSRI